MVVRLAVLLAVLLAVPAVLAGERPAAGPMARGYNGLAATPPMGWNDYNAYGLDVTEEVVRATADTMVSSGLRDAGYRYVTIDDGWMAATRDAYGRLQPDPARFPHGIAALAAYVHARGLKLGIYADAGVHTCGGLPGSLGHERDDAALFAAWGVDYLKYDNCYAGPGCADHSCPDGAEQPARERYARMRDALLSTGRPIVFSICSWGTGEVARWAAGYGNLWRTTGDITATYASLLSIFHQTVGLENYAGPGGWNDPDMLEVGNGMTAVEDRTELTLWAALAAPLVIGTDLVHARPETLTMLTNPGVIAVDQDPLGKPARLVSATNGLDVLSRPLAGGDTAIVLVDETDEPATIAVPSAGRTATDVWTGSKATVNGEIRAIVPAHGAMLYRVSG